VEEAFSAAFDRMTLPTTWERAFGGASKPIMRLVTLLAIADIGCACVNSIEAGGEASSRGETVEGKAAALAGVEALFLPKLKFHFDGFFVTGAGTGGGCFAVEVEMAETGGRGLLRSAVGMGYIQTGS
jgi:hypothetical protein